ncbi:MAG: hypothetical protein H0U74_13770 [Bradymonadaceae bacterium]|nr:hypothetical protein [Lujinxingiaceae bacterium]
MHAELNEFLQALGALREALDDPLVRFVSVTAAGHWTVERQGTIQARADMLSAHKVALLVRALKEDEANLFGSWSVRRLNGGEGATLVFDRRAQAALGPLPDHALEAMRFQATGGSNGVILGLPGAGTAELLLWVAKSMVPRPLSFVSDIAPVRIGTSHANHLYPPRSSSERATMERLLRRSATVLWDHVSCAEDLRLLWGVPGQINRWLSIETVSVSMGLLALQNMAAGFRGFRIDTLIVVRPSATLQVDISFFARRSPNGWEEVFAAQTSHMRELEIFDREMGGRAPTSASSPFIPAFLAVADFQHTMPSMGALEELSEAPPTGELHVFEEANLEGHFFEDSVARPLKADDIKEVTRSDFNVAELLAGAPDDEDARQSGEIDLQALFARRLDKRAAERELRDSMPEFLLDQVVEDYDHEHDADAHFSDSELERRNAVAQTSVLRGHKLDSLLPQLDVNYDDLESFDVHPDQLRYTVEQEIDVSALQGDLMRAMHREISEAHEDGPGVKASESAEMGSFDITARPTTTPRHRNAPTTDGRKYIIREESTQNDAAIADTHRALKSTARVIPSTAVRAVEREVVDKTEEFKVPESIEGLLGHRPKSDG